MIVHPNSNYGVVISPLSIRQLQFGAFLFKFHHSSFIIHHAKASA